jgi:hypothetical protein
MRQIHIDEGKKMQCEAMKWTELSVDRRERGESGM